MTQRSKEGLNAMLLLIQGFQAARLIKLVADLGLADRIDPGAVVLIADLAAQLNVDATRLLRLCRALAAFGVFTVHDTKCIGHSDASLFLRTDSKPSLHYMARFWAMPSNWATWGAVENGLRRGQTAAEMALGISRMEYFNAHPDEAKIFNAAMAHRPEDSHSDVAAGYDFSDATLVVDVGGGNGALLERILSRYDGPKGLTFDRDEVVQSASEGMVGLLGRHRFQGGNFLAGVPAGGDVYLLSDVLGSLSDENCLTLLRNCRAAMVANGRILVIERILSDDPSAGNPIDYLIDLHFMLIYPEASLRSVSEHQRLLSAARLRPTRVLPTASSVSIIEARAT